MEDGGNFGVSIQLAAIKVITDQAEKVNKGMEELYGYASARYVQRMLAGTISHSDLTVPMPWKNASSHL